jgi:hypothetical protein
VGANTRTFCPFASASLSSIAHLPGLTAEPSGTVTKNKQPLRLILMGQLLALVARRWALRFAECPYVFHRAGREIRDFRATWMAACEAVGVPGLLFHDLRRSGARNYRRAGVAEM